MSPIEVVLLIAMVCGAMYHQSQPHVVTGPGRFGLALVYIGVGLVAGGLHLPDRRTEVTLLVVGLALGVAAGVARGRVTRLEVGADGRVWGRGTPLTVSIFLLLVLFKATSEFWAYAAGLGDAGGFGEILLMIGLMAAFQAEIVWRRSLHLLHEVTPVGDLA